MSAETVGRHMPPVITLDDLTAMMAADEHHRYEISPEGVLSVMPPAGYAHAIISPGSEATDTVAKRTEYAGAGIPQYWTVDQDAAQTVTMYHLDGDHYQIRAAMPLAWVLNTTTAEHSLG